MSKRRVRLEIHEPPTVVADLNGKIIYINPKAKTFLNPVKLGANISKYLGLDYVRKLSMMECGIDSVVPARCNFQKAVVKICGSGATKTVELSFFHTDSENEENRINDKRLFASYSEIIASEIAGAVKLNDIVESIVSSLKTDLRFAYRHFELIKYENDTTLYANTKRLSSIIIGTIILLNELEYKNPIKISIDKILDTFVLNMSVNSNTFKSGEGLHDMAELFPRVAMRLSYIAFLCENEEVSYNFCVKPNSISASFEISDMVNDTGIFKYAPFAIGEREFVSYIASLFAYNSYVEQNDEDFSTEEGERAE